MIAADAALSLLTLKLSQEHGWSVSKGVPVGQRAARIEGCIFRLLLCSYFRPLGVLELQFYQEHRQVKARVETELHNLK